MADRILWWGGARCAAPRGQAHLALTPPLPWARYLRLRLPSMPSGGADASCRYHTTTATQRRYAKLGPLHKFALFFLQILQRLYDFPSREVAHSRRFMGGPEMVGHVDSVGKGYTTSCELVSTTESPSTEHGSMSKTSWVAHVLESTTRHELVPSRDALTRPCRTWGTHEADAANDRGGIRAAPCPSTTRHDLCRVE